MEYIIENIPLLAIAVVIICIQYRIYDSTCGKIKILKSILSNSNCFKKEEIFLPKESLSLVTWPEIISKFGIYTQHVNPDEEKVTVICLADAGNPITQEIETSIDTYLLRNKGAVSDFNLIKDIVERNCDALATEVESQTAMPLYLGLIGTVAGIVLGLASLALQGQNLGDPSCIMALMAGVAFAMIASGAGVLFTSLSIWKNKQCSATLEANKNKFYTWIQTELLPVLSSSTVSTLALLERNLTHFNATFSRTVTQLDKKLSNVGNLYGNQIKLLEKLEKIDVLKMATANVTILETLTRSVGKLDNFARYLEETTDYLKAVKELNGKIDEHLARTEALETISDFYKNQMGEIELRQNVVKSVATGVDEVVKKALADLKEHTQSGLEGLQLVYTKQQEVLNVLANEQGDHIPNTLKKLEAVISLTQELLRMPAIVAELSKNAQIQTKATNELANAVRKLASNRPLETDRNGSPQQGLFAKIRAWWMGLYILVKGEGKYAKKKEEPRSEFRTDAYTPRSKEAKPYNLPKEFTSARNLERMSTPTRSKEAKPYNPKKIDKV